MFSNYDIFKISFFCQQTGPLSYTQALSVLFSMICTCSQTCLKVSRCVHDNVGWIQKCSVVRKHLINSVKWTIKISIWFITILPSFFQRVKYLFLTTPILMRKTSASVQKYFSDIELDSLNFDQYISKRQNFSSSYIFDLSFVSSCVIL